LTGESFCNQIIIDDLSTGQEFIINYINTAPEKFDEQLGKISMDKLFHNLKNYFKLYKILNTQIVYATIGQTFAGVLKFAPYFLTAKLFRKKIIIHIHGNNLLNQYQQQKGIKQKIFHWVVSMANKGIVLSENLKSNLQPFLSDENIEVLPNFVDKNLLIKDIKIIENKDFSKLKILYLSNLMTQKGIFELLDALAILDQKNIDYQAVLAGNIDESIKKNVLQKIQKLPNLSYAGVVTGSKKSEIFLNANVFVLPSYREGQPLSVFEAMATGNIVVSTSHPGITDIFNEQQIIYIDKKSTDSIVKALEKINDHLPDFRPLILSNYKYIAENFTEEKFIKNFKKIIQN